MTDAKLDTSHPAQHDVAGLADAMVPSTSAGASALPEQEAFTVAGASSDEATASEQSTAAASQRIAPTTRVLRWCMRVFGGPVPAVVAIILTAWLGLYTEVWGPGILVALTHAFDRERDVYWPAVWFVIAVLATAVVGLASVVGAALDRRDELRKRDTAEAQQRLANTRLEAAITRLERADIARQQALAMLELQMRTLPDERFLSSFQNVYTDVHATVEAALAGAPYLISDIDELQNTVRVILNGIASLAQAFDGADADALPGRASTVYGTNVMVYYPSTAYDEVAEVTALRDKLRFVEPDVDLQALEGILELRGELSTSTDAPEPIPDPHLRPLALPVPAIRENADGMSRVLPGAPDAFVTAALQRFADRAAVVAELERRDVTAWVKGKVRNHFAERPDLRVRSFISVPLLHPQSPVPLGVLNVHRNRAGILRDTNPEQHFTPIISPLLLSLTQILVRLLAVEALRDPTSPASSASGSALPTAVAAVAESTDSVADRARGPDEGGGNEGVTPMPSP